MNPDCSPAQAHCCLSIRDVSQTVEAAQHLPRAQWRSVWSQGPREWSFTDGGQALGVHIPAFHRPQGGFGGPFSGMSPRPRDLTVTPLVAFYTFHASLPRLLILGIIPQINYLQVPSQALILGE